MPDNILAKTHIDLCQQQAPNASKSHQKRTRTHRNMRILMSTLLLSLTLPAWAAPLINGIASHSEFNKERFIGALYSETLSTDANTLLQAKEAKRLELRITANRLSARRLNKMWIEGMAINNSGSTLAEQAENMVSFTGLLKKKLIAGDHVVIDYTPGAGTSISVNGTTLGNIANDDFFNLLLRTWIGNVPLSSEFRASLLTEGEVDSELLARFESAQPSEARRKVVAAWNNPAAAAPAAKPAVQPEPPTVVAAAPAESVNKPSIAAPTLAQAPTLEQPSLPAPVIEPEPTTENLAPENLAPETASADTEMAATATPDAQPQEVAAEEDVVMSEDEVFSEDPLAEEEDLLAEDDEEADEPLLTAESLLSRQLYHSKLLKWTYKYIRYPKRAVSRGHEGSVRLNVTIDRNGNVQHVAELENSRHSTLNKEALKAVKRATPFPPVPEDVTGEDFEFSLPIVFRLPK